MYLVLALTSAWIFTICPDAASIPLTKSLSQPHCANFDIARPESPRRSLVWSAPCSGEARCAGATAELRHVISLKETQLDGDDLPPHTLSLTYDDGPDAYTIELAQYLHDAGIQATFFVNRCRVQGSPPPVHESGNCYDPVQQPGIPESQQYPASTLETVVTLGHRIANHTADHVRLVDPMQGDMPPALVIGQVRMDQMFIDPFIADGIFAFRPPYNAWSPTVTGQFRQDTYFDKMAGPIDRTVDGTDWHCALNPSATAEDCAAGYVQIILERPNQNGLVQMHDRNEFAVGEPYALNLTRALVETLRSQENHFYFVPLDALKGVTGRYSFGTTTTWSVDFSDVTGWASDVTAYGSIRLVDVDGNGKADICARASTGIVCGLSNGTSFEPPMPWLSSDFLDSENWNLEPYGSTIQFGDVDGDGLADVCGRGPEGVRCYFSNGADGFIGPAIVAGSYSDEEGWGAAASYYRSIRLADIDGDGRADVCGRSPSGILCAVSNGRDGFQPAAPWLTEEFSDEQGWGDPQYGTTLQLADINHDQRADVCGRKATAIVCALAKTTETGFGPAQEWTPPLGVFSDQAGWDVAAQYKTIHLADINGDGAADICGRAPTGLVCAVSNGVNAFTKYIHVYNEDFRNDSGWEPDQYGSTIQFGDINGDQRADVCGRGTFALLCTLAPVR